MIAEMYSIIEDNAQRNELEEFYKENLNNFLNLAYSNLHNTGDAEDAVEEAFRRIAEKVQILRKRSQI